MTLDGQRPKIYLLLCLVALFLESVYIFVNRPIACGKCKTALVETSREFPGEFCQPCVEQIRAVLGPSASFAIEYDPPYPVDPSDPVVTLETTRGKVEVELFPRQAPISTENFLRYVRAHHYDGVIFHRIEDYLCVTGRHRGGYDNVALTTIPQFPPIPSESGRLDNRRGTLSLPHLDDDANSATSDFFFNLKDSPFYDRSPGKAGYAVFGQVLRGYEVVDGLRHLPVTSKPIGPGWERMPASPILIRRAYVNAPAATTGTVSALDSRTIADVDSRTPAGR